MFHYVEYVTTTRNKYKYKDFKKKFNDIIKYTDSS